jgi:hypothetical protein
MYVVLRLNVDDRRKSILAPTLSKRQAALSETLINRLGTIVPFDEAVVASIGWLGHHHHAPVSRLSDVLDPADARVNQFAAAGGLTLAQLLGIVGLVRERFALAAAAITAYDPEYDEDEKALKAAVDVIRELSK